MTVPIESAFVDMDGVLTDFTSGILRRYGLSSEEHQALGRSDVGAFAAAKRKIQVSTIWDDIDDEQFWVDLSPFPCAAPLLRFLISKLGRENVYICSSPGGLPSAAAAKMKWLAQHGIVPRSFGERSLLPRKNVILTGRKWLMGQPGRVLIDDHLSHAEAWLERGGQAVWWPWSGMRASEVTATSRRLQKAFGDSAETVFAYDQERISAARIALERMLLTP